jgi:hypothetical protein
VACLGIQAAVDALQTETEVKDKIAIHWIDLLVQKARNIQQARVFNKTTRDARLNGSRIKGEDREIIKQGIISEIQDISEFGLTPINILPASYHNTVRPALI